MVSKARNSTTKFISTPKFLAWAIFSIVVGILLSLYFMEISNLTSNKQKIAENLQKYGFSEFFLEPTISSIIYSANEAIFCSICVGLAIIFIPKGFKRYCSSAVIGDRGDQIFKISAHFAVLISITIVSNAFLFMISDAGTKEISSILKRISLLEFMFCFWAALVKEFRPKHYNYFIIAKPLLPIFGCLKHLFIDFTAKDFLDFFLVLKTMVSPVSLLPSKSIPDSTFEDLAKAVELLKTEFQINPYVFVSNSPFALYTKSIKGKFLLISLGLLKISPNSLLANIFHESGHSVMDTVYGKSISVFILDSCCELFGILGYFWFYKKSASDSKKVSNSIFLNQNVDNSAIPIDNSAIPIDNSAIPIDKRVKMTEEFLKNKEIEKNTLVHFYSAICGFLPLFILKLIFKYLSRREEYAADLAFVEIGHRVPSLMYGILKFFCELPPDEAAPRKFIGILSSHPNHYSRILEILNFIENKNK